MLQTKPVNQSSKRAAAVFPVLKKCCKRRSWIKGSYGSFRNLQELPVHGTCTKHCSPRNSARDGESGWTLSNHPSCYRILEYMWMSLLARQAACSQPLRIICEWAMPPYSPQPFPHQLDVNPANFPSRLPLFHICGTILTLGLGLRSGARCVTHKHRVFVVKGENERRWG